MLRNDFVERASGQRIMSFLPAEFLACRPTNPPRQGRRVGSGRPAIPTTGRNSSGFLASA